MSGTAPRTVQQLSLADLKFDPDNPRQPSSVNGHDESEVLDWMLRDESLPELIGSIGAQDYFAGEPVLVAPEGLAAGPPYIVVEGNRRLAAIKLLADPTLAPTRKPTVERLANESSFHPQGLPAIVFDDRDQILDYLGYRHVTGVKEWDPLAKARYVDQLVKRAQAHGQTLTDQELARRIGSRADYVRRLRDGLSTYDHIESKDFYGLDGVNEDSIDFAVLTTALSYENIADFVESLEDGDTAGGNDENLKDLVDWVFRRRENGTTVLGESRNLGLLAAIVGSPEARAALKDGVPIADAALLTDEPLKSFRRAVSQSTDKLKLARGMTHRVEGATQSDVKDLADLTNIARELAVVIESKVKGSDPTV